MEISSRLVGLVVVIAFFAAAVPATALTPRVADEGEHRFFWEEGWRTEYVLAARDTQSVEDHGGYTSEYIFGMTKGVMRSTLTPALKPVVLLLTVPLDLVFLPFAAIGGFFR